MKIASNETPRQLDTKLAYKQKRLVQAKQKELEAIRSQFDNKITDQKARGEVEVIQTSQKNQADLQQIINDKTERFEAYSRNLANEYSLLEKQKQQLLDQHKLETSQAKELEFEKIGQINERVNQTVEEIEDDLNSKVEIIKTNNDSTLTNQKIDSKLELDKFDMNVEQQIVKKTNLQQASNLEREKEFQKQIMDQEKQNAQELKMLKNQATAIKNSVASEQNNQVEVQNKIHQNNILKSDQIFKDRSENLKKEQAKILKTMEDKLAQELNKLIIENGKTQNAIADKVDNSFYNVTKLNPEVTEQEGHYLISLEVPEYEKENVRIHVGDRDIKLHYHRRYGDEATNESNEVFRTKRSESISKEFHVANIVEPRGIKQNYENGVLSFKVMKK